MSNNANQSIKNLVVQSGENARTATASPKDPANNLLSLVRAIVTGGDSSAGYSVTALKADATVSSDSWTAVSTFPGGEVIAEGAYVLLRFEGPNDHPEILVTGSSGSGDAVVGVEIANRFYSS